MKEPRRREFELPTLNQSEILADFLDPEVHLARDIGRPPIIKSAGLIQSNDSWGDA